MQHWENNFKKYCPLGCRYFYVLAMNGIMLCLIYPYYIMFIYDPWITSIYYIIIIILRHYYYFLFIYSLPNCKILVKYNWNSFQLIKVNYSVHKKHKWSCTKIKYCVLYWDFIQVQTAAVTHGFCLLDHKKNTINGKTVLKLI